MATLACPQCQFQRDGGALGRPGLCPRCQREGEDVYLVASDLPKVPGRRDLRGLLANARAELANARSESARGSDAHGLG
jgi:hypothetical protein